MSIELIIMFALLAKHGIVDYALQCKLMIMSKVRFFSFGAGLHSLLHGLATAIVVTIAVDFFSPGCTEDIWHVLLVLSMADAGIHHCIDWCKAVLSKGQKVDSEKFWLLFGVDQTLHMFTYVAISHFIAKSLT